MLGMYKHTDGLTNMKYKEKFFNTTAAAWKEQNMK